MERRNDKDVLKIWDIPYVISKDLIFEEIRDDRASLKLIIKDPKNKLIQIIFDNFHSYRKIDESFLLKLWHSTPKETLGNVFYKIENSSFIDFFHEMSLGFYSDWKMKHYGIYTIEDCIDVLSTTEPIICLLN